MRREERKGKNKREDKRTSANDIQYKLLRMCIWGGREIQTTIIIVNGFTFKARWYAYRHTTRARARSK